MKKTLIISTVLIVCAVIFMNAAPAQATEFGITGGLNMANMSGDFENNKAMMTFGGGFFGRMSAGPQFTIHSEVLYMMKGTKWDEGDEKLKLNYIEVPVLLMYNVPMTGPVSPCIFAGPYYATLVSAKSEFEGQELDMKEAFADNDFGVVVGAGVDIKMGPTGKIFLNGRYSLGLSNANDFLPDEVSVKHGVISLFAGFGVGVGP